MAKGGYRAGAGRPPGIKETRPRRRKKPSGASDQAKIREMLSLGIKAKARMYQELLHRVGRGEKLTVPEMKRMDKIGVELAAAVGDGKPPEAGEVSEILKPLAYMLKIMNDPHEEKELRARMAIASAPYVHPRKGEGAGKKEDKGERARAAGCGKFAASAPPHLKVVK